MVTNYVISESSAWRNFARTSTHLGLGLAFELDTETRATLIWRVFCTTN